MAEEISCPTCGKPVALDSARRPDAAPFCSRRCRLVDLGAWADGAYAVGRPLGYDDSEILEDAARSAEGRTP